MGLVTLQDAKRLNFDVERRNKETASDYMRAYLTILQLAHEYEFISVEERDAIAKVILLAVNDAAHDENILISNYVYIIGMRLFSISNYEGWELLKNVTSKSEADKFIVETKAWFSERMNPVLDFTKMYRRKALELRNSFLNSSWETVENTVKILAGALEEGCAIELKAVHKECVSAIIMYRLISSETGATYIDRVEDYARRLAIETSILIKYDAGKLMRSIAKQRKTPRQVTVSTEVIQARQVVEQEKARLDEIEASYTQRLKKIAESEAIFDEVLTTFEEEHPDMDEEEFEEAFDEYWMAHPSYSKEIYSDIEDEYKEVRRKQQERVYKAQDRLDELEESAVQMQSMFIQKADDITLETILKEFAIFYAAQQGQITYPQDYMEKELMTMNFPLEVAVQIFLQNEADKVSLTAQEQAYLKN